jgi:polyisoprenoid-binding protein YceI
MLQLEVLDGSSIAGYYKEARHASELAHKRVLVGGSMTTTAVEIPGYVTGTWTIDPVHSEVSFVVRHMMVSKVRGRFDKFEGTIQTAQDPLQSTVTATVDLSSVNTGNETRDNHIRSEDFFHIEKHPTMTFRSTGIRPEGENFLLDGDLTLHGVTKLVTFFLEVNGFGPDPYGGVRTGFSATTEIDRNDWEVSYNGPIPGVTNAMVLSDKVTINLEIEAVLNSGE